MATLTDLVRRTRLAALIATHNYAIAAKMDRVLVLDEGHLVERAPEVLPA
jgi:lipoprotein-releasing system ATP-binding protein